MYYAKRSRAVILSLLMLSLGLMSCGKDGTNEPSISQVTIYSIKPTHGPYGTIDTITGAEFNQLPTLDSVFLNHKKLTIISRSDTQIIVSIPKLAGTGPVSIWTPGRLITGPVFHYDTTLVVTTLAGTGVMGTADGPAAAAGFDNPAGIAVDGNGHVYVAEPHQARIRKITPQGVVSTFAGSVMGEAGWRDGQGTAALFNTPLSVAVDAGNNVYVGEHLKVRKIDPNGNVRTLAGSNEISGDGPAATAGFSYLYGIAVHTNGDVFVSDQYNHNIRKITLAGMVSTWAGGDHYNFGWTDGQGTAARFYNPAGIAIDKNGRMYVADPAYQNIRQISPTAAVTTLAGTSTSGYINGTGAAARFLYPSDVAADRNGNVFVADKGNNAIRRITPGGTVTTYAGGGSGAVDGPVPYASFRNPAGVAVDSAGNIYVSDQLNHKIRKISWE
jgi:hypothetical protein